MALPHTSRHFEAFARQSNLPFLCVRAGDRRGLCREDNLQTLELPRGFLSFRWRRISASIRPFRATFRRCGKCWSGFRPGPDPHHRPERSGRAGRSLAYQLRLPLAASWHTNVHEYAARRSNWFLRMFPSGASAATGQKLKTLRWPLPAVLFMGTCAVRAQSRTVRSAGARDERTVPPDAARSGLGTVRSRQTPRRTATEEELVLGYVGRLSVEKNVALLARSNSNSNSSELKDFHFRLSDMARRSLAARATCRARSSPAC